MHESIFKSFIGIGECYWTRTLKSIWHSLKIPLSVPTASNVLQIPSAQCDVDVKLPHATMPLPTSY